ncbi:single-stranded DNA-binding protein [Streptomyces sp. NBC_01142]|uniref:single-stranded DNA-binding protein n=1 Tax=Streptomyces sp. NBC_01142 TaxID=2975865 RepID=UPI0022557DC1|nr:single-stranded DNA-binding protein [Streptomyces sp. NBC_01142]MCX4820240.1 single-stranded DNA-binding protein [Streptomyces sp. NBC_01142]
MVDTGPAAVSGLPDDLEDTEQINAQQQAAPEPVDPDPEDVASPAVDTPAQKPPEKPSEATPDRTPGAFPDVRPMIQRVGTPEPGKTAEAATPQEAQSTPGDAETGEAERQRVKLVGRLRRTPSVRENASGKLVGKFPLAVHLEDGTTQWHNILAFGERAAALKTRMEAGELVKGNEIEVVGYLHAREYQGRDGMTKTVSYVVITRWVIHGAGYVELDCSGRLMGARQAVDSGGTSATAGRWNTEHA